MTEQELRELTVRFLQVRRQHPCLRKGQTWFNVLYEQHPALADEIRSTEANPFYVDDNLSRFFEFITKEKE